MPPTLPTGSARIRASCCHSLWVEAVADSGLIDELAREQKERVDMHVQGLLFEGRFCALFQL